MTTVPDEGTSQLNQAQVIGRLLVGTDQYRPTLGQPAQGAFHDPSASRVAFLAQMVQFFLTDTADVSLVPVGRNSSVTCGVVIPFVQTQVLSFIPGIFRTRHHYMLQSLFYQLGVVNIGSGHYHAEEAAVPFD